MRQTGNGAITKKSTYAAFISYAHADERTAKRLHEALETYPLPKDMRSWDVEAKYRARLKPVFRDVAELTAHHSLSEKIREAVRTSRFLIVLCSPAARKSHWVNEEIRLFRRIHGEAAILAVIVEGKPHTAFPPALTEAGREPLAADISGKEGFRFGVTQLAASMLGVGLDRLVQRDQRRRRFRTQAVSAASTALALIMGGLAWTAFDARDLAEVSQEKAEVSRNAAEEMVEFVIKDLKDDLVPIQRLELFDNVGKRVAEYYDAIPLEDMDDDRLMRQARARHIGGEVSLNMGDYKTAESEFQAAYDASKTVYQRNPDNTDAIFTHAQSEYWMGWTQYEQREYEQSSLRLERYKELATKLYLADVNNYDWIMEAAGGWSTFALVNLRNGQKEEARKAYERTVPLLEKAIRLQPENATPQAELANIYSGMSQLEHKLQNRVARMKYQRRSVHLYKDVWGKNTNDLNFKFRYVQAHFKLLRAEKEDICRSLDAKNLFQHMIEFILYDPENIMWQQEYFMQWKHHIIKCPTSTIIQNYTPERFFHESAAFLSDKFIAKQIEDVSSVKTPIRHE